MQSRIFLDDARKYFPPPLLIGLLNYYPDVAFDVALVLGVGPDVRNLVWFCTSDFLYIFLATQVGAPVLASWGLWIYLILGFISRTPDRYLYFGLVNLWYGLVSVVFVLHMCKRRRVLFIVILYFYLLLLRMFIMTFVKFLCL
jgi:hypothetical protein